MEYQLTKGPLTATISSLGAELKSLRRNGTEYLWQGNPEFWNGQSPLLFPNTGRVWDGKYRLNGQVYEIEPHGFARHMEFTELMRSDTNLLLAISSNEETKRVYPFDFFLFVEYTLDDNGLEVKWTVKNEDENEMYFQIGAHPAFNLPAYDPAEEVHGYFGFKTGSTPIHYLIPEEKGCVNPGNIHTLELDSEEMMPITGKTFDIDTYVIDAAGISSCTLYSPGRVPWVKVSFDMPILSLWAPTLKRPDCPFVCIEPWCGSCDTIGYEGDIADRRIMNRLPLTEHFTTTYRIDPA